MPHLRIQLNSAVDNLITSLLDRGLGCSSSSVKHSNPPLDHLHCRFFVEKITRTQEIHHLVLDAKSYSHQGSISAAFSPYHGPGMEQQSPRLLSRVNAIAFLALEIITFSQYHLQHSTWCCGQRFAPLL